MDVPFTIPSLSPCILERVNVRLDINPEWVQLAVARTPGGSLTGAIPGQVRPASQYLAGWTRDFVTVLGPPQPG
jgi:hypothetical protein